MKARATTTFSSAGHRKMLDALHIAVFALDDNGRMVYANPAFAQRLGKKADALADADIHALLAPNASWKQPTGLSETEAQSIEFRAADGTVCMTMHHQKLADKLPLWLFQENPAHNQKPAESGDYHQMVLSAIPDLLFVLDETGCITGFHSPTDVLTDGAGLSLTGKHFRHFLPEEMGIIVQKTLEDALQHGSSEAQVYRLLPDSNKQWFSLSIKFNAHSARYRYIALLKDITSLRHNEEALAHNEVLFRSVIEQSNEGIVLIDSEGKVMIWNRRQVEITGLEPADTLGRYIWEVLYDLGTPERKASPGVLEEGKKRMLDILQKKQSTYLGQPMESEIVRNDGAVRLISTTLFPVEFGDQYLLGAIHRDITDAKKAELTLLENEEYIRTLYYDSPVPVVVIEENTRQLFDLNKAALEAFGFGNSAEVKGKSIMELMPPENDEDLYFNRQQIIEKLELISSDSDKTFNCHFRAGNGDIWDARVHTFRLSIYDKDLVQLTLIDTTAHNKAMKALFESESRYRAVAENANAGIAIVDLEERIVYSNETLAHMLGYPKEDIIGELFSRFVPEATYKLMAEKTFQRFNGVVDQYEAEFFHSNGSVNTFSVSASPLFSSSMEMIGTVGVMIDITQQKKAARELIETSEQLQAILASMPDMIFILDREGQYLDYYINQKLFPHAAYQPRKGQYVRDIFTPDQAANIENAILESLETRETVVVSFDFFVGDRVSHFEARLSPMSADKVVSVVRDTTTLITLESELVFNNELMRMLTMLATRFINLPLNQIETELNNALAEIGSFAGVDRVYIFDYDWDNDTMSNTFEWCSEGTLPAIDELQQIPNSILPEWVAAHRRGRMTHVSRVSDLAPDDNLRQILEPQNIQSLITLPLMEASNCLGYVGFDAVKNERSFTDSELSLLRIFAELLTNLKIRQRAEGLLVQNKEILQKQNEQLLNLNNLLRQQNEEIIAKNTELDVQRERAQASDRLKTAFLNNVSHELRTPLNGIIGFAQFLADDQITAEDKEEFVAAMNISVSRLTDTINDIMDVSLLMSGNMMVHPEKIDPRQLINDIRRKYEFEASSKGLLFEAIEQNTTGKNTFLSDLGMIQKILNELVGNAIKYTQKGFVRYGYKLTEAGLQLIVEDSGIGISKDARNKIFEPFMQEDNSSTRKYEGSGLGLTIVKGLTELLGGKINLESGQQKGTSISINIPSADQKHKETIVMQTVKSDQTPTILIAEDEVLNVLYLKRILKNSEYNLLFAQNGEEAVKLIHEHPEINLVLMDIKMPVMDGLEATRLIRLTNDTLPIIAVTAYAANDDRHACMAAGCSDYISKPFTADDLKELIKKQYEA